MMNLSEAMIASLIFDRRSRAGEQRRDIFADPMMDREDIRQARELRSKRP
ncbi:MAG: hypothetical protein ABL866_08800 [Devosia sp.]